MSFFDRKIPFDAVVTDIKMPNMDGIILTGKSFELAS